MPGDFFRVCLQIDPVGPLGDRFLHALDHVTWRNVAWAKRGRRGGWVYLFFLPIGCFRYVFLNHCQLLVLFWSIAI